MKIKMQSNRMSWFKTYQNIYNDDLYQPLNSTELGWSNAILIKHFYAPVISRTKIISLLCSQNIPKHIFISSCKCCWLRLKMLLAFVHRNGFIKICRYFNNAQRDIDSILKVHNITFSFIRGASHWFAYLIIFNNNRRSKKKKWKIKLKFTRF